MSRPRVLIADDHRLLADAYERVLGDDVEVVGKVGDGRALVDAARELDPDLVVLDISMPRLNGIDAARQILEASPEARLVFVTMHKDARMAARALELGARAYVLKASAASELVQALHAVLDGRTFVSPLIGQADVDAARAAPKRGDRRLTPRQREVLQLLAEGRLMKQVARELGLTARTVAHHKYKIMREQNIESNAELVQLAIEEGLIPPPARP